MWTHEFLMLATAHFLALLSPGPDFFLLVGCTAKHGVRHALGAAVGIACANAVYIGAALAGFGWLTENATVHAIVRLLGAVYLAWLGAMLLRSARANRAAPSAELTREEGGGFAAGWWAGVLSGGLNPKNGVFYLGLFAVAVGRGTPLGVRVGYGAWMFTVVLLWDTGLVLGLGAGAATATLQRHRAKIEGVSGACLLALAAVIASGAV